MRKILCLICSIVLVIAMLPLNCFAAKSEKVTLYGNKISVNAKQICFVAGEKDEYEFIDTMYDTSFKKYYYVGDNTIDIKTVAEKLPKLQNLVIIKCDVKNLSYLSKLDDLVWLGLHQCDGSENLSFLKKLTGLKKFRYTKTYSKNPCKSIKPVSYLKNLTELYLDADASAMEDITPLKGLKKLKKLTLEHVDGEDVSIIKNFKNLRELKLRLGSERTDVSFLSKLDNLESLDISGNTAFLDSIVKTKSRRLSKLSIDSNDEDLSFIGSLLLEELSLSYVNSSFTDSIKNLGGLKYLSLMDINNGRLYDMSFMERLYSLETLMVFGNRDVRLHGNTSVKNVSIMLSSFSSMIGLNECENLESLVIYNNNSDFHISWIEGMKIKELSISDGADYGIKNMSKLATLKQLETLTLDFTGISDELCKAIKKALPKCEIEVCELGGDPYSIRNY
ncbi:MAG: hypothetical protein IJC04_10005 [Oscillospiraceae bacterium]|nr:hypothetical protein [Oscillospiraceae bacterium]